MNAPQAASAVTFTSTVALKDEGPFLTFKEALENFMRRMRADCPRSLQAIETACWIRRTSNGVEYPLCFYNARDFGFKTGLLHGNSEFNPNAPEPSAVLVSDLYAAALGMGGDADFFIRRLKDPVAA